MEKKKRSGFAEFNMTTASHKQVRTLENRSPEVNKLNFKLYLILLVLLEIIEVTNGYHDEYCSDKSSKEAMVYGSAVLVPSGCLLEVQNPRIHSWPTELEYISLPYVYILIRVCEALMIKIYCIKKSKKFSVVLAPSPFLLHLILFFKKIYTMVSLFLLYR